MATDDDDDMSKLDSIQDTDALQQELDDMLGSLTNELEELVNQVNSDTGPASTNSSAVKERPKRKEFLRPTSSPIIRKIVDPDEGNSSESDDEELSIRGAAELQGMMKSVDEVKRVTPQEQLLVAAKTGTPLYDKEHDAATVDPAQIQALLNLSQIAAPDNYEVASCTVEEFLAEDNGFQESDDEGDEPFSADEVEVKPGDDAESASSHQESTGYWASMGSYASAGWGYATASIEKATELSKSSLEATKQSIAGKVSAYKTDPALLQKCEEEYLEIVRVAGGVEMIVTSGQTARVPFIIPKGCSLTWKVRVKEYDIGFGVRERKQEKGGAVEEPIGDMHKLRSTDRAEMGTIASILDRSRQIVFVFDNSYSKLRPKTCAYSVRCVKEEETDSITYSAMIAEVASKDNMTNGDSIIDVVEKECAAGTEMFPSASNMETNAQEAQAEIHGAPSISPPEKLEDSEPLVTPVPVANAEEMGPED